MVNPLNFNILNSLARIQASNQLDLNRTLEHLSTGLRVNRAADSPSAYPRIERRQTQLLSNQQARLNTQAAALLGTVASDGAGQILNQLQRLRELTLQSLSETTSDRERSRLQSEFTAITRQIDSIARSTEFNGRRLLDGSTSEGQLAQAAQVQQLLDRLVTHPGTGVRQSLLSGFSVDGDATGDVLFQVSLVNQAGSNTTALEISSSTQGLIARYADFTTAPLSLVLPLRSGSAAALHLNRNSAFGPAAGTPLTAAELNQPLQNLVSSGRLPGINYGTLALTAGGQVFSHVIDVTGSTTLNQVLNAIRGLSNAQGSFSAGYDAGAGKITIAYTGSGQATSVSSRSYVSGVPGAAGGPYSAFALITPPPQGPAYRDPSSYLPAAGFAVGSSQSYFPVLPAALDASLSFGGSDASLLAAFGLTDAAGRGNVMGYTSGYYGETIATGGQSEYINRLRLTIDDVTASQSLSGSNTGLTAADAGKSFRVLNSGVIDAAGFGAGDFSIDFGTNGLFTFSGFDPAFHSIQDILDRINAFKPGYVSASFDAATDRLTLNNTPQPGALTAKVTDPGLGSGGSFTIDFGSNGVFSYNLTPGTSTIQSLVNALNAQSGVTASFDAGTDQLTLTNTVSPSYGTKVIDPPLSAGTFAIDFGSNGAFSFAFDPATHTIQDLVNALNAFKPGSISASYDAATDRLSINNTANPVTDTKAFNGSAIAGSFIVNFGENGVFTYVSPHGGGGFNPANDTIQDVVNALNAFKPGSVSASYDAVGDRLSISNTSSPDTRVSASKVSNPPLQNGAFSIDFGSNGVFNLSNPQNLTIQGFVDAINAYGATVGNRVSASYNATTDRLTLNNTPLNTTVQNFDTKIANSGLGTGTFSINFGTNGVLNFGTINGANQSIGSIINAINNYTGEALGGNVSASWDAVNDRISISNSVLVGDNQIQFSDSGTGLLATLRLASVSGNLLGTQTVTGSDIDKGSIHANLNIDEAGGDLTRTLGFLASNPVATTTTTVNGSNAITISDGGTGAAAFFRLGSVASNGSGLIQSASSAGDIDRSSLSSLLDITSGDVGGKTLNQLATEQIVYSGTAGGDNRISFGGTSNLQSFFRLSSLASNGLGGSQSLLSAGDIDKSSSSGNSLLDIGTADVSGATIGSLQTTPVVLVSVDNRIVFSGSTGLQSFFRLSNVTSDGAGTRTALSAGDIDNSSLSSLLDITSGDVSCQTFASLASQPILIGGGDNNSITFGAGLGQKVRDFFRLSDRPDSSLAMNGSYTQTIVSSAAIDNGPTGSPYDITPADVSGASFQSLITPFASPFANNQIIFGGTNGAHLRDLFNFSDVASNGSTSTRTGTSSAGIDNGALDASLELNAADVSGRTIAQLLTPRLSMLVSGPLVLDGGTVLTIDPNTTTLNEVIGAINAYSGPSNKTYSASFASGRLSLTVTDRETLTPSAATPAANPGEATPRIVGNALIFDSAAYIASDAPKSVGGVPLNPGGSGPAEQAFGTSSLDGRYSVSDPSPPANLSSLSFGGLTNLAAVLQLGNVGSGNTAGPSVTSDEYHGVIAATGPNSYMLTATHRRGYSATSASVSGVLGVASNRLADADTGLIAEFQIYGRTHASPAGQLSFQYGGEAGQAESFGFANLTAASLRLEGLSLLGNNSVQTRLRGENALHVLDQAIDTTITQQSRLGMFTRSMEDWDRFLATERENIQAALADDRDADIPSEIGNLARQQLLSQSGARAFAEALAHERSLYGILFGLGLSGPSAFGSSGSSLFDGVI